MLVLVPCVPFVPHPSQAHPRTVIAECSLVLEDLALVNEALFLGRDAWTCGRYLRLEIGHRGSRGHVHSKLIAPCSRLDDHSQLGASWLFVVGHGGDLEDKRAWTGIDACS